MNRKSEYMGENNFGLPQDVISNVCTSKYFGNIPPDQYVNGLQKPRRSTAINMLLTQI